MYATYPFTYLHVFCYNYWILNFSPRLFCIKGCNIYSQKYLSCWFVLIATHPYISLKLRHGNMPLEVEGLVIYSKIVWELGNREKDSRNSIVFYIQAWLQSSIWALVPYTPWHSSINILEHIKEQQNSLMELPYIYSYIYRTFLVESLENISLKYRVLMMESLGISPFQILDDCLVLWNLVLLTCAWNFNNMSSRKFYDPWMRFSGTQFILNHSVRNMPDIFPRLELDNFYFINNIWS
jgi:hypothetical protein